ncbi:unnamed protein product, partial [Laminaria digitata]
MVGNSPASLGSGSAREGSTDDRLAFGHRSTSSGGSHYGGGGGGGGDSGAVSSDWLMAGEAARAGMIDSVAAENNGRPGPLVVDDGVFQARLLCPSKILQGAHARDLAGHLPGMTASSDWVCLFSDSRHGSSLKTLLARCQGWEPTLVVIEASVASTKGDRVCGGSGGGGGGGGGSGSGSNVTGSGSASRSGESEEAVGSCSGVDDIAGTTAVSTVAAAALAVEGVAAATGRVSRKVSEEDKKQRRERVVFGGFASGSQWKKNMGRGFDGNGESFLFSFNNKRGGGETADGGSADLESRVGLPTREGRGSGGGSDRGRALSVYPWAGSNRSFMTSDDAYGLGMGGGGNAGNFGFFLEADLRKGSSGWCETFRNQPLAAAAPSVTAASLVAEATGVGHGGG